MDKFQIRTSLHDLNEEKWVSSEREDYLKFMAQDPSRISVTSWKHMSVNLHRHDFYELVMVVLGGCVHYYRGVSVTLVPGDIFLVSPHETHGYSAKMPVELMNCQFYRECLDGDDLQKLDMDREKQIFRYDQYDMDKRRDQVLKDLVPTEEEIAESEILSQQECINRQGIIHLEKDKYREIQYLFKKMLQEQRDQESDYINMKSACLQMILTILKREQNCRVESISRHPDDKNEKVYQIIHYMEEHLEDKISMNQLAQKSYWSKGYFSAVFKDVTGLSPIEYLNRLRIVKSLEYLRRDNLKIAEAAARVGIYDPSYYSRLFKKVMGYPPRYFTMKALSSGQING